MSYELLSYEVFWIPIVISSNLADKGNLLTTISLSTKSDTLNDMDELWKVRSKQYNTIKLD
jgi:hypothetical protein